MYKVHDLGYLHVPKCMYKVQELVYLRVQKFMINELMKARGINYRYLYVGAHMSWASTQL